MWIKSNSWYFRSTLELYREFLLNCSIRPKRFHPLRSGLIFSITGESTHWPPSIYWRSQKSVSQTSPSVHQSIESRQQPWSRQYWWWEQCSYRGWGDLVLILMNSCTIWMLGRDCSEIQSFILSSLPLMYINVDYNCSCSDQNITFSS